MSALLLKLLFFTHAYYIVKTKLLVRKTGSTIATVSCTSEVLADQSLSRVAKPPGSCVNRPHNTTLWLCCVSIAM